MTLERKLNQIFSSFSKIHGFLKEISFITNIDFLIPISLQPELKTLE